MDWTMIRARRRRALRERKGLAASGGEATMRSISAARSPDVLATGAEANAIAEGRAGGIGGAARLSGCGRRAGRVATGGTKSTSSS
jgi:hypothetical protein